MQTTVAHFCDEMVFFPWVPFIQMHAVINISLDLMIGTWIYTTNFIMKRIMWLFIEKNSFVNSNGLLKFKKKD
jgi:hypothetical protein